MSASTPHGTAPVARPAGHARALAALVAASLALAACHDASAPSEQDAAPNLRYASAAADAHMQSSGDVIPDEYIVVFRDSVSDPAARGRELAAAHGGTVRFTYTSAIKGFAAHLPAAAVDALRHDPRVAVVESDGIARAADVQTWANWGIDRLDQRSLPVDATYTYPNKGEGVNVYILDTGIRSTHVEFGGRVVSGFTAFSDAVGTQDCNGHGTHVAGVAGSAKYGVAKGATLYSVRVLNCDGSGSYSSIIGGIDWVTKNRKLPAVANMSIAAGSSSTVTQAVQASIASGVVYTVAAGNSSVDACGGTPASVPEALTVAASDRYDAQASFSDYGSCVDLYAPGVGIPSTFFTNDTSWAVYAGTSQAAPHVAGVAAMYLAAHPTASPADVAKAILGNATSGVVTGVGPGTPNLLLYMGFMNGDPSSTTTSPPPVDTSGTSTTTTPPPPPPPTIDQAPAASFTASCPRGKCTFDASGSSDDHGIASYAWDFGDGSPVFAGAGQTTVVYSYKAAGTYVVRLTVTDGVGQTGSASQSVTIKRVRQ